MSNLASTLPAKSGRAVLKVVTVVLAIVLTVGVGLGALLAFVVGPTLTKSQTGTDQSAARKDATDLVSLFTANPSAIPPAPLIVSAQKPYTVGSTTFVPHRYDVISVLPAPEGTYCLTVIGGMTGQTLKYDSATGEFNPRNPVACKPLS